MKRREFIAGLGGHGSFADSVAIGGAGAKAGAAGGRVRLRKLGRRPWELRFCSLLRCSTGFRSGSKAAAK
jgi:hypothetical protein